MGSNTVKKGQVGFFLGWDKKSPCVQLWHKGRGERLWRGVTIRRGVIGQKRTRYFFLDFAGCFFIQSLSSDL